jgi:hypothetical protein
MNGVSWSSPSRAAWARAERLLPLPLAGHGVEVGAALEIAQWLGTQPEPGSATRDR